MNQEWIDILKASPLMDPQWYAKTYHVNEEDAIEHYLSVGWKSNFDPSLRFSTLRYLQTYPDVQRAMMAPLLHYEKFGRFEEPPRVYGPSASRSSQIWKGYTKTGVSRASYCPESGWHPRKSTDDFIKQAEKYDYISFDIFDTLLLRNVYRPTDIFRIMGTEMELPEFARYRRLAEARCYETVGPTANIYDIYQELARMIHIDVRKGIETEFAYELMFCYANPYMKKIYDGLRSQNKKLLIVSDMYWPEEYLARLLEKCGYGGWSGLYVSCGQGCRKGDGTLQKKVWETVGTDSHVLHIGDNKASDIAASEVAGWDAKYYESCRDKSNLFYGDEERTLPRSIASAICCNTLNNGFKQYSKEYEHGFLYGGILCCGFCGWLNRFAAAHGDEQIWFLARDMDIVYKIYNEIYPQADSAYVAISRNAVLPLNIEEDPEPFFHASFDGRAASERLTAGQALEEAGLSLLQKYLCEFGLHKDEILRKEGLERLHRLYRAHVDEVCQHFQPAVDGAEKYFKQILKEHRKICIVDLGWQGTVFKYLVRFLKRKSFPVEQIHCVMLGAVSSQETTDMVSAGLMHTYLYSGVQNADLRIREDTARGNMEMMCLEAMFSADQPTLAGYGVNEAGEYTLNYGEKTSQPWQIRDIQQGILDFTHRYHEQVSGLKRPPMIYPADAFGPYLTVAEDFEYLYLLFHQIREHEDGAAAADGRDQMTTLGNIMQKRGLL